ncbi:ankyrin repeat-containing domain protein [Syncephalis fuscata]|nr:ankyrin repeat-containing domain protein [Syncephalis fuscata]
MAELIRYQTRKLQQVPIKAKIRKRYVIGFKESLRTLLLDKARCIIMAKNIEYINPSEEQLDPLVVQIQQQCHQRSIPLVYSMTRRQLGSAIGGARGHRTGGVGCIALLMIDGAESLYDRVLTLADQGRHYWQDYFCSLRPATDALTPWNSYGETPVWLASWHGYSNDVLCKCIDNGWSVDTRRQSYQSDAPRDWTPLMAASYRGHAHILSILLRKGAQANVKDQMGKSALLLAIEQGHVSVVHELLKLAATLIDVNIKDNDGNTALQIAIQGKHIQIVRALLEQDQLNISDTCDDRVNEKIAMSNPLLLTIQLSLHDVLFELYQYYEQRWIVEMTEIVTATFTPRKMMLFLNSRLPLDDQGRNPFILACAIGNLTVCQTLLICMSRPISIPMPGAQKRRWKIDRAERQRQLINQPDEQGRTALWWASANGHISLASWLCGNSLDHLQIDRELKDQEGKTASDVAALYYKDWLNNTANEKLKDVAMKNQKKQTDSRIQQLVYDICRTIAKPSSKTLLPSNKNDNNDD